MSNLEPDPSSRASEPVVARSQLWPRLVGAVALAVLGACGVTLLVIPSRPPSLISRSNWDLATVLPTIHDFSADWNYSLDGPLRRAAPANTTASRHPSAPGPASVYTPAECENIPKVVELYGTPDFAAMVHVDRNTETIA